MLAGRDAEVVSQERDAEEEHDEDGAQPGEDDPRVVGFGRLECRHAVGDRLHPGERRAAGSEGAEEKEESDAVQTGGMRLVRSFRDEIEDRGDRAVDDEPEETSDEQIGWRREELARLADTAEIGRCDGADGEQAEAHAVGERAGERRRDGGDAGGDTHGDGQHVIDQQRRRGDQAWEDPEVVLGDDVRAPALRVRTNRLTIRADDDGDEQADGDADR